MSEISFSLKIYDNFVEIIPDQPIEDNSIYEISIDHLKAYHKQKTLSNLDLKVHTKMTPSYCSLEGVKSLVETIDLPDDKTLYYIREASRKADYLAGKTFDEDRVPFEINQFVKYRAAHDTLLKFFIDRAANSGLRGKMGEIEFEEGAKHDSLKDLLNYLKDEANKWETELMGEDYRKGAAPKAVIKSKTNIYATKVSGFGREVT